MPLTEDKNMHASWQASTFDMRHFVTIRQPRYFSAVHHLSSILLTKGNDDIDKDERQQEIAPLFNQVRCTGKQLRSTRDKILPRLDLRRFHVHLANRA